MSARPPRPFRPDRLRPALECDRQRGHDRHGPFADGDRPADPEALERLLDHAATQGEVTSFGLEFSVAGLDLVVTDAGEIVVYDCASERESADGLEFTFER